MAMTTKFYIRHTYSSSIKRYICMYLRIYIYIYVCVYIYIFVCLEMHHTSMNTHDEKARYNAAYIYVACCILCDRTITMIQITHTHIYIYICVY